MARHRLHFSHKLRMLKTIKRQQFHYLFGLDRKISNLIDHLRSILRPDTFIDVQNVSQAAFLFEMRASHRRFYQKFLFLHNKQYPSYIPQRNTSDVSVMTNPDPNQLQVTEINDQHPNTSTYQQRLITNLSTQALTPDEEELLAKGPKFSISSFSNDKSDLLREYKMGFQRLIHSIRWHCQYPQTNNKDAVFEPSHKDVSLPRLIPAVEQILRNTSNKYLNVLKKIERMRLHSNLTPTEWQTMKHLKSRNLILDSSDKGGEFCVVNKEMYHRAMLAELVETGKYRRIAKIDIKRVEDRMNSVWKDLCKKYKVDNRISQHYLSHNSNFASVRGLIKTHKITEHENDSFKIRLVINTMGTPGYRLSWFIQKSIFPSMKELVTNTSSKQIMNEIRSINRDTLISNKYPFSLDVVEMFHSVPRNEAIQILVDILTEKNFSLLNIPPNELGTLIDVILRSNQFMYENQLFIQHCGLPIGNRLSGLLADVFISKIQNTVLTHHPNVPCYRYVDDFLLLGRDETHANEIHNQFNQVHDKIKFEIEIPNQDESIPFLDFSIKVLNGKPVFKFYQKPTKKPIFIHARSALPKSSFNAFISNERERIRDRCTEARDKIQCLHRFNQTLQLRGHNINRFKRNFNETKINQPRFFLSIPFISDNVNSMIRSTLAPLKLKICISHKTKTLNSVFRQKVAGDIALCQQCGISGCGATHVVYQMTCNKCGGIYIGSTYRRLHMRVREHLAMRNSLVYQHPCKEGWSTKILWRGRHVQKLRFMEALLIREKKPTINGKENIFDKHILF
jgi:hypothetical protein